MDQINTATETPATLTLTKALAEAQGKFRPIPKSKSYCIRPGSRPIFYADLGTVLSCITPALSACGIAVTWRLGMDEGRVSVECILRGHGAELSSGAIAIMPSGGNNAAQALGSAMTYARRYTLFAVAGICPDDDDDGLAAGGTEAAQPAPRRVAEPPKPLTDSEKAELADAARGGEVAWRAYWNGHTGLLARWKAADEAFRASVMEVLHAAQQATGETIAKAAA